MNIRRRRWALAAMAVTAIAALMLSAGHRGVRAGSPAPQTAPAAVRLDLTISLPDKGGADPYPMTATGVINTDGGVALEVRLPGVPAAVPVRVVDGRLYVALVSGAWRSVDLVDLLSAAPSPAGRPAAGCRAESVAIDRLLADPLAALGGLLPSTRGELLDGVVVDQYAGSVAIERLYESFGAFFGVSAACGQGLAEALLGATAGGTRVRAEVTLGRESSFPYRLRFLLPRRDGGVMEVEARLAPSTTPFAIVPPGPERSR